MVRTDILDRKDDILQWINENKSKAFICQQLKCKPETLNRYLTIMNISYKGQQNWRKGHSSENYKTVEEYIKNPNAKPHRILEKLIKEKIKEDKCEMCGITYWFNQHLPLELHHKDRNHFNNDLNNLMILCPNCHSIQEGNSGSNIGFYNKPQ